MSSDAHPSTPDSPQPATPENSSGSETTRFNPPPFDETIEPEAPAIGNPNAPSPSPSPANPNAESSGESPSGKKPDKKPVSVSSTTVHSTKKIDSDTSAAIAPSESLPPPVSELSTETPGMATGRMMAPSSDFGGTKFRAEDEAGTTNTHDHANENANGISFDAAASMPESAGMSGRSVHVVWFVHVNRQQLGPFTYGEVCERLVSGDLLPKHYIWRLGFGEQWYRIREVPEFADVVHSLGPAAGASDAPADKLVCTNCFARVLPAWKECPGCGMALKLELPGRAVVMSREPYHQVMGLAGSAIALIALFLPWLHAATATNMGAASISGFDVYLGSTFAGLALVLGFLSVQSLAGGPRRALLTFLLALAAGVFVVIFVADVVDQSPAILAALEAELAPQPIAGTFPATDAQPLLGLGFYLYAIGVLLVGGSFLVPAVYRVAEHPIAGGITITVVGVLAALYFQVVNGNLYEPIIRLQLETRGFTVEKLDRAEPGLAGNTPRNVQTFSMQVRRRADKRLYIGHVEVPLGSIWPLRTIHLQRVPEADEPLLAPEKADSPAAPRTP